ncbi:hypothetical protein [Streptomyces sp. NPDC092370]|uniref:hypothetical protein n=1 Tax=Streptomyces sp. NPDC092370 TaxID=3366016 RepID=UPI003824C800
MRVPWPSGARRPLAGPVEDLEDAREEWKGRAPPMCADHPHAHYDKAYAPVEGPATVTARKVLGPAAAGPASGEGEWADSGAQV